MGVRLATDACAAFTRLGVHDLTGALDTLSGDDAKPRRQTEAPAMLATGTDAIRVVGELTVDERRNNGGTKPRDRVRRDANRQRRR